MVALGVAVAVLILAALRLVVIPTIVALLLTSVFKPPADALVRRGVPPAAAVTAVMVGFVGLLVGLGALLAPSVRDQFRELGPTLTESRREIEDWLVEGPLELSREDIDRYTQQILDQFQSGGGGLAEGVVAGATIVGEILAGILLTYVLLFFFVKDADRLTGFFLRQVRPEHHDLLRSAGRRVWQVIGGYLRGTAIVAFVDAAIIGIGLSLIGVPLVGPLAVLTFFGAFLPLVGAVAAGVVAVLVALVSGGVGDALLAAVVVITVQQVEGDVLAPLVLGRAVRLHPVVVLVVLTAGAVLGGILGAFLAVPVAAVAVAVGSELRAHNIIGPGLPEGSER